MLIVILNRLIPQIEEIVSEEQAGFRAGRNTTDQSRKFRILSEKCLQHQQNLNHVFVDFKKSFDRVWHAALLASIQKYNVSAILLKAYDGDQCQEDKTDDKQRQRHPERNKGKSTEAGSVTSFKYLGAAVSDDGSKPEILSRIAQATAALTKLQPIWRDNNISLGS